MKIFTLLIALIGMGTTPGEAILPPLYQGIRELQAILSAPEIGQKLESGDVIEKIIRTDTGFKIVTNKREVVIHIEYSHNQKIGPADFMLKFEDSVPY